MEGYDALQASRDAAYWAGVAGVAAWVIGALTLIINGVGLYLVREQLRSNTKAIKAASKSAIEAARAADASIAASRPWVQIAEEQKGRLQRSATETLLSIQLTATNVGQSPALQVWQDIIWVEKLDATGFKQACERPRVQVYGDTLFPGTSSLPISMNIPIPDWNFKTMGAIFIVARALYRIPGEDFDRRTSKPLMVTGSIFPDSDGQDVTVLQAILPPGVVSVT